MKKVCGTCLFGFDGRGGGRGVEVLCAHDNLWWTDNYSDCGKWTEYTSGFSKKDIVDMVNRFKDEENESKRHEEPLQDSKANRKNQILLVVLGTLLGVLGTLLSQYMLSLWRR